MQKRDNSGRFLSKPRKKKLKDCKAKKMVKKANKKARHKVVANVIKVEKASKLSEFTIFDLQDMIQAEVQFQMKELW